MAARPTRLDYEATLDCVHCGLCLPVCPTYQETGNEASSPRGRIYVMRGVAEGRISLDRRVADEMHFCLACRACESACPAGVRYGHLIETMRAEIDARGARSRLTRLVQRAALRRLIGSRGALRGFATLLRGYQRSGLEKLLLATRLTKLVPGLDRAARALPRVPAPHRPATLVPARGRRRGRVALFEGCVMPELFGSVNAATVRVLAQNGFEVQVPRGQGCCGALHLHSGDPDFAAKLQRRNLEAFGRADVDAVIVSSAGCGAALKEAGDALAPSVRDVSEFLIEAGLRPPPGPVEARVAYDDACHLLHGQQLRRPPRQLLEAIPGLSVFDLPGSSDCCGAAGIYALTHGDMADRLLARKVEALRATRPDCVATGNPGCLMQIARGVRDARLPVRVMHPVELLDRAY